MAPIKFEEHVKESLEKRRIEPKKDSWDKLSDQLGKDENRSKPKIWIWMAVAASFAGLVFIATTVFNAETEINSPKKNIVETESINNTDYYRDETEVKVETETKIVENPEMISEKNNKKLQQVEEKQFVSIDSKQQAQKQTNDANLKDDVTLSVAEANLEADNRLSAEAISAKKDNHLPQQQINQKIEDAIAQVETMQTNGETITDAYIDSLLQRATADITKQSIYKDGSKKVDARALLAEVEFELEKSFRDKVFDALKTGFEEVRTAVANRNQ